MVPAAHSCVLCQSTCSVEQLRCVKEACCQNVYQYSYGKAVSDFPVLLSELKIYDQGRIIPNDINCILHAFLLPHSVGQLAKFVSTV